MQLQLCQLLQVLYDYLYRGGYPAGWKLRRAPDVGLPMRALWATVPTEPYWFALCYFWHFAKLRIGHPTLPCCRLRLISRIPTPSTIPKIAKLTCGESPRRV